MWSAYSKHRKNTWHSAGSREPGARQSCVRRPLPGLFSTWLWFFCTLHFCRLCIRNQGRRETRLRTLPEQVWSQVTVKLSQLNWECIWESFYSEIRNQRLTPFPGVAIYPGPQCVLGSLKTLFSNNTVSSLGVRGPGGVCKYILVKSSASNT